MTISSKYMAMADAEVLASVQSPFVGMTDPRIASLRCFKFYSRESGSFLTSPEGIERWFGPKAAKVYAIAHRDAGTHTTMKAIAAEAMCCVSTVSRALTRLQAFGFLAVDVKRGRNGGITVRLRRVGDALKHYAAAAWGRIRSWIKVASRSPETGNDLVTTLVRKDATFTEVDQHERCRAFRAEWGPTFERLGEGVLDCASLDHTPLRPSEASREADRVQARSLDFARDVIREIRRLDEQEPDWDLWYDKVRASHGLDPL